MTEQRLIDANALKANMFLYAAPEMVWDKADIVHKIDEMPTIEERKTGKWVGVKEYCDHLNEKAKREGKGNRYLPSGMNIRVYCNQCWESNDRRTTYCPDCGARMVQEGENNGK